MKTIIKKKNIQNHPKNVHIDIKTIVIYTKKHNQLKKLTQIHTIIKYIQNHMNTYKQNF